VDGTAAELLPPPGRRPLTNAVICLGVAIAANVALAVLIDVVDAIFGIRRGTQPAYVLAIVGIVLGVAANLVVLRWFAVGRTGWSTADLGLRRVRSFWRAVGLAVACYLGFIVVAAFWVNAVKPPRRKHVLLEAVEERPPLYVIVLVVAFACVAAPIVEELLFRGFLYRALSGWRGHLPAALISSAVFGALHANVVTPSVLPVLGLLGFAFCVLYHRTGSLLPSMGLHAFQNSLATGIAVGMRGWTVALIAGSWLAIWVLLTPWRRADALPGPRPPRIVDAEARNLALPDWSREPYRGG
jgi:membrane protease YdiL (CAAX protease family)